jgi:hypothetical protein
MKILLFTILMSSPAWSLTWSTGMHHIGPLMQESDEALKQIDEGPICSDPTVTPVKYISDKPRTEAWRSYYKVPKLLTDDLYKVKDVCAEAKKMNASQGVTKKYALVANKTHLCDGMSRACLSTFKSISDPCNSFVQDNFQVFHTRTFIGQHKPAANKEIMNEYGNMGPSLLVINLETCELVPTEAGKKAVKGGMDPKVAVRDGYFYTPPSLDSAKDSKGVLNFKSDDDRVRFDAMKTALITNIPQLKTLDSGKTSCFEGEKRSLPGIGDMQEVQYGEIKVKGFMAMRKLMDEQYIDKTGIYPYSK